MAEKKPVMIDGMMRRNPAGAKPANPKPTKLARPTSPSAQAKVSGSAPKPPGRPSVDNSIPKPKGQPPITGWNWGAFLLSWIWAIGNRVWIGLLALIPITPINLIVAIYLGMKGNELAWRAKQWDSPEQFIATQRKWTKWAVILFVVVLAIVLISALVVFLSYSNQNYLL